MSDPTKWYETDAALHILRGLTDDDLACVVHPPRWQLGREMDNDTEYTSPTIDRLGDIRYEHEKTYGDGSLERAELTGYGVDEVDAVKVALGDLDETDWNRWGFRAPYPKSLFRLALCGAQTLQVAA